jgi:dihydrofolate synthase/folylpolyglutamate synthase
MFVTEEEALRWIHSRKKFGSRPGLTRISELLRLCGHPEQEIIGIHIAGTNGKGSTVTYLRCLLESQELTVGTFTSPYIESFYERISLNGKAISAEEFIRLANEFQPLVAFMDREEQFQGITEFEILTAMAFSYFQKHADIAIFETGIGGKLDSTNVFTPILAAITTVGLDHTDLLGETVEEIALQKAGILKKKVPIVLGNIPKNAVEVIEAVASKKEAPLFKQGGSYHLHYLKQSPQSSLFHFENEKWRFLNLRVPLLGKYQAENAATALQLFLLYCQQQNRKVQQKAIQKALDKARWPGRMEKICSQPTIFIDGAHNPHAIKQFVETVTEMFPEGRKYILFSALTTKNSREMIRLIQKIPNHCLALTTFDYPQAWKQEELVRQGSHLNYYQDWQQGIQEIVAKMGPHDTLFITGSLYFVAQVREYLLADKVYSAETS